MRWFCSRQINRKYGKFITSVNSFDPALKDTWEIFENTLAFLDIRLFVNDNGLSTSVYDTWDTLANQLIPITVFYIRPLIHNT